MKFRRPKASDCAIWLAFAQALWALVVGYGPAKAEGAFCMTLACFTYLVALDLKGDGK